jgi:hypothetical protein
MKNPLIDVAAILICLIAVIVGGQYFINQKREKLADKIEVLTERQKKFEVDLSKFESAVKRTE